MSCPQADAREDNFEKNLSKCPYNRFVCLEHQCMDFVQQSKYYVSAEMCDTVRCIREAVSTLKLAFRLFKKNPQCTLSLNSSALNEKELLAAVGRSEGQLTRVRRRMNKCNVIDSLDLHIRQIYHQSMQDLHSVVKDLGGHLKEATHLLNEYCANLGVTDRFGGYRSNLSQPFNDPLLLLPPNIPHPPLKPRKEPKLFRIYDTTPKCHEEDLRSIQEKFGIMADYPGKTEYCASFTLPKKVRLLPYIINPTPNYNIDGRTVIKRKLEPFITSYFSDFQWPDASKLPSSPWLRE